ncbi:MAG: DUF6580 family putative transport protein, partial [Rudaea sp.]
MQHDAPASLLSPRTGVLIAMIAFAVGMRLVNYFVPGALPNFTPVEAIALFGGAYFANRRLAFIVPLIAMVVADAIIGVNLSDENIGFWYRSAPAVYACIALTVLGGLHLRNRVDLTRVFGYSFASAVLFFVVTNFAVWLFAAGPQGDACVQGLLPCYVAARPQIAAQVVGDQAGQD